MKKIAVAVTLDDKEGMMLFGKRQSSDRGLISEFVSSMEGREIFISPFSKRIFEPHDGINIADDPIGEAPDGAVCFIENMKLTPYLDIIDTLIIYRWNRLYPSDVKFDVDIKKAGFTIDTVSEFAGSSHEKITKEIYRK